LKLIIIKKVNAVEDILIDGRLWGLTQTGLTDDRQTYDKPKNND
jgi:hypothetical protein